MKKKHKILYLSKETIATLTGGSNTVTTTEDAESTLPACTSICSTCPPDTDSYPCSV